MVFALNNWYGTLHLQQDFLFFNNSDYHDSTKGG